MVALLVITTFVAFILADAAVQWAGARQEDVRRRAFLAGAAVAGPATAPFPRGLFAAPGHTWVALEASGQVRIGMDAFAGSAIGRIDGVELPEEGRRISRGDPLFTIHQGGRKAVFSAPVDGVVSAVNPEARGEVAADPYRKGWICALDPAGLAAGLRRLLLGEEAVEWLRSEAKKYAELLTSRPLRTAEAGAVLADGGQVAPGALEAVDDETWNLFAAEFLGDRR